MKINLSVKRFILGLILFILFYYLWILVFSDHTVMYLAGISLLNTIALIFGLFWLFFSYRQAEGPKRYVWFLLIMSFISIMISSIYFFYAVLTLDGALPFPNAGDFLTFVRYILVMTAVVMIIRISGKRAEVNRFLFNILLFTAVVLTLSWPIYFEPLFNMHRDDTEALVTAVMYPTVIMMTLFVSLSLLYFTQYSANKLMMTLLTAGLLFQITGDIAVASSLMYNWADQPVWYHHLLVPSYALAWLLIGYAGLYGETTKFDRLFSERQLTYKNGNMVAYGSVTLLIALYFISPSEVIRNGLVFILLLIVIRQYFVLRENRRLNDELESLVEQKTGDLQKALNKMEHVAKYDHLTGLPNRRMIVNELEMLIDASEKKNETFALLFIDMDRFKTVNDTLGHKAGDELLKQVAEKLKQSVRDADKIGRYGGDEFIILLKDVDEKEIRQVATRIKHTFIHAFNLEGKAFYTSPSIGVSMYPEDGTSAIDLIKYADIAMYDAKSSGGVHYRMYQTMSADVHRKLLLEDEIRSVVPENDLYVMYQPVHKIDTGELTGFEALMRWRHPEMGEIMPGEFIGVADETGMIVPMGRWIMEEASKQLQFWNRKGIRHISISINLSSRQLYDPDFLSMLREVLATKEIEAGQLELELTERGIYNEDQLKEILLEVKKLGISVVLDDFGTERSSMTMLNRFPFDRIKVDQSVFQATETNEDAQSLLLSILDAAKHFGLEVVAEGIEHIYHMKLARELGFDTGQGYYYNKPLLAEKAEQLLFQSIKTNE
ncbi:putative bifunctional diguanylate cyclase/phosphodiesterase [Salisediminibacterium selenitireducens]|uniref:Diguanylate cyclase/phosphodiesterase n=1 Tax=Bacillus selenitireducens (strain ATCC 700615 / DSM 15326 / MLS10) TaxID=439292 RepID=D6XU75_BACIE|nr:EAL domain-containing protein [Salisediminibacterium selenitireducens]ADH99361.1 diguanylate cyclase/phosphodiesterase [[Bacillus] selenitireducens MLS10]